MSRNLWFTYELGGEYTEATVESIDDILAELREVGYQGPDVEVFNDAGQTVAWVAGRRGGMLRVRFS